MPPTSSASSLPSAAVAAERIGETQLSSSGLTLISYGGYLNGESFQQDGILSYKGTQYAAYWNSKRHVVLGRRQLAAAQWQTLEFTDYSNTEDDAHNTISLGVSPADATLHLAFDHHGSDLHYRRSTLGFLDDAAAWDVAQFSKVSSALVASNAVSQVTYPRFITEPGGNKLLFQARIGSSGSGDEYLWEYDGTSRAWTALGKYIDGVVDNINAYPHGVSYTPNGERLHVSWCWRETPSANTNHDLLYVYSDDHGRTWKNNAGKEIGRTGSSALHSKSAGLVVWEIGRDRGLINQEHMAIDTTGRVHVLLSHMPDSEKNDSDFDNSRKKSQYFDYIREVDGKWRRVALGLSAVANLRGKLAITSSQNVYAVLPDLRLVGASLADNFSKFTLLDQQDQGRFFSDPLIDSARLLSDNTLSVVYPVKNSPNIFVLDFEVK